MVEREGEPLSRAGGVGQSLGAGVVAAHRAGDLGEVPAALGGHHDGGAGRHLGGDRGERALLGRQPQLGEGVAEVLVERGDPVVVEPGRDGAEHRQVLGVGGEQLPVAGHLAAHVAQGVGPAAAVELVDGHDVGQVEHVDLLELAGGAELGGHDVEGRVDVGDDAGVALADARGLDDDQVGAGGPARGDDVVEVVGHLAGRRPGGERAEEDRRASRWRSCGSGRRAGRRRCGGGSGRRRAPRDGPCRPGPVGGGG